ncbi:hypothetical protein [Clostridium sp. OS1-26]|uniref:hypothetical protein n=1 Tax=Clostridium sp. OS1-26 TaxID=3070681 RepID=UPI0027E1E97E|nr:hypothetical protein [Clostridium sp. OS1-26]WML34500.1 hypothetical protein RCG18_24990 [Clostridium sp. OS1-26]
MSMIYLPSCKFTAYSMEASKKIKGYLSENYDIQIGGCCRPGHKKLTNHDTVVYICNTCAAFCRENSSAEKVISIWELLDNDKQFPYPDYDHRKMAVQDCWRVYDNDSQQKAIRRIIQRMNIDIEELDENYNKTRFCGVSLYEPLPKQNGDFAPKRFIENAESFFLPHTEEEQITLMKKHCDTINATEVICYCIGCIKGINLGGKKGIHLLDLIFGLDPK